MIPTGAVRFDARLRPGFNVRPHVVTWGTCVFAVHPTGSETAAAFVALTGDEVAQFLTDLDSGRLDETLRADSDQRPRHTLRGPLRGPDPGVRVGVEQELRVLHPDGTPNDFRSIVHTLGFDGVRADPTDPNAYRCSWGGVLTCDGPEVELATPPIAATPGCVGAVVASLAAGRAALVGALPSGHRIAGYSTHVNVSLDVRRDIAFARRYARTYAAAMMLLLDRADSPGLLVRPRPGRFELCGEYATGTALEAAIAFALGSVLALGNASRQELRSLRVDVELEAARERFGLYVDREAFGADLYRDGRATVLRGRDGLTTAGDHLRRCWSLARAAIGDRLDAADLRAMDRIAAGIEPVPCEGESAQLDVAL